MRDMKENKLEVGDTVVHLTWSHKLIKQGEILVIRENTVIMSDAEFKKGPNLTVRPGDLYKVLL